MVFLLRGQLSGNQTLFKHVWERMWTTCQARFSKYVALDRGGGGKGGLTNMNRHFCGMHGRIKAPGFLRLENGRYEGEEETERRGGEKGGSSTKPLNSLPRTLRIVCIY